MLFHEFAIVFATHVVSLNVLVWWVYMYRFLCHDLKILLCIIAC